MIKTHRLRDIVETDSFIRPPELFSGFMLDQSLSMIAADPFTGKSMLTAAMIVALDAGLPLFGKFPPTRSGPVLAFLQDAPDWDYAEQIKKIIRGYGLTEDQISELQSLVVFESAMGPTFITAPEVTEMIAKVDPIMVVFDAFWTCHDLNEMDKSEMAYVMGFFKRVRAQHRSIMFTHHNRKLSADDSRAVSLNHRSSGSHVISAACDNQIFLAGNGDRIRLTTGKSRGQLPLDFTYEMTDVDHPDGAAIKLVSEDDDTTRHGKLLVLLAEGAQSRAEMIAYLKTLEPKLTTNTAGRAVDRATLLLQAQRKIRKTGRGIWELR